MAGCARLSHRRRLLIYLLMLTRFRDVPTLRRLVDEVQDPPLLVLEYLDSNTLAESRMKGFKSSDAKLVAKAVLETLAAFHAEGIVHTSR